MTKALRTALKRLHVAELPGVTHVELTTTEALALLNHIEALELTVVTVAAVKK